MHYVHFGSAEESPKKNIVYAIWKSWQLILYSTYPVLIFNTYNGPRETSGKLMQY